MAKKRTRKVTKAAVTAKRAPRLFRLLKLLGKGPQTRDKLIKQLSLDIRSFYRDLSLLRDAKIEVKLKDGRYVLNGNASQAISCLPLPDPLLTLGEAQQLAKGKTEAHRKLRKQIAQIVK